MYYLKVVTEEKGAKKTIETRFNDVQERKAVKYMAIINEEGEIINEYKRL